MSVTAKTVDFSNVKDRGQFNPRHVPVGDYLAKVVKVEDGKSKSDEGFQYIFTIKLVKFSQNSYPYYCKLTENQVWKLRNLLIAAGMSVPKKRVKLDPSKVIGKLIGVTMEDDEYEGRLKSVIQAVFPANELEDSELPSGTADDEDDEDQWNTGPADDDEAEYSEDVEVDTSDAEPELEDDEEEEADEEEAEDEEAGGDQFDEMDRNQLKRHIKKLQPGYSVKRSQSDDDLRQVARELEAQDSDDDEDPDELEIEDL